MAITQSYNSRSKKWVVRDGGKIKGNFDEKQEGITVKKGKPESDPEEPIEPKEKKPVEHEETEIQDPEENQKNPFLLKWW